MSNDLIEQSVHGYRRGHEWLAGSFQLRGKDKEVVTSLSDLSGLPLRDEIPPYLTSYPLPNATHYAIARTWLDYEAPREGCVLTHTLFVPMWMWRQGISARAVFDLFIQPRRNNLSVYENPAALIDSSFLPNKESTLNPRAHRVQVFARKFFAEGRRPLVWLDSPNPDEMLIDLLEFVWPSLRADFSACTHALKMRFIQDNPFRIVFAPAAALSRFSDLEAGNIIRESPQAADDPRFEPLDDLIARSLALGRSAPEVEGFKESLPADPTALLKIAVLDGLKKQADKNPASSVAAMDVLAVLIPAESAGIERKREAAQYAIDRALKERPQSQLKLIGAILNRLSRPAFRRLKPMRANLLKLGSAVVAADPEIGLQILLRAKTRSTALVLIVATGLADCKFIITNLLNKLEQTAPDLIDEMLRYKPSLARRYSEEFSIAQNSREMSETALLWMKRALPSRRTSISNQLADSPILATDPRLFEAVIAVAGRSASEKAIRAVLSSGQLDHFQPEMWSALTAAAPHYSSVFLDYVSSAGFNNVKIAEIWARVVEPSVQTVELVLDLQTLPEDVRKEVVVLLLSRQDILEQMPYVRQCHVLKMIDILLNGSSVHRALWQQAVRVTLSYVESGIFGDGLPGNPVKWAAAEDLDRSTLSVLVHNILESVVRAIIRNLILEGTAHIWLEWRPVQHALRFSAPSDIAELWRNECLLSKYGPSQRDMGERVWMLLCLLGPTLVLRQDRALSSVIDAAFHDFRAHWSDSNTAKWLDLIKMSRAASYSGDLTLLDAQSVQVALSHPYMNLCALLEISFPAVYSATVSGRLTLIELFYFYVDWDKGKELRRSLIRAFVNSDWPPRAIALIADDAGILDKITSRLSRTGHTLYLTRVIGDLETCGTIRSGGLAKRMRRQERRAEDWD
ncbi:hypothetical protein FV242_31225 [Methylobacterium sp. WL64]|uniref:GAP1-N1 domain-containing protein n=1 Tax=Methylobacterium sp. WL64 TaxID=2603894 RepID=UPI0011C9624B|nr:hypothetical protein [Methylobacterium sp. WL64]TXM97559.1 hypothetical protein FV242_31225 [Methylobacterium sp. WL64]